MAFPWAAAVTAGAGIGGTIIGAQGTEKANHDAMNFALMQGDIDWKRQMDAFQMQNDRDDSTWNRQNDYNLQMWNQQNAYNSPAAQMARYKEAGLNPALIYGQSNTGGSVATANLDSGKIGSARPGNYTPDRADYSGLANSVSDGILKMLAFREQAARTDNLKAANEVMQEEKRLKSAQVAQTLMNTDYSEVRMTGETYRNARTQFDNDLETELRNVSVDARRAALYKVKVDSDLALRRDEREAAMNSNNLMEGAERILNMRNQRVGIGLENKLKQLDLEYKGNGQPYKDYVERTLGRILNDGVDSVKKGRIRGISW